ERMMRTPHVALRRRGFSFWDRHGRHSLMEKALYARDGTRLEAWRTAGGETETAPRQERRETGKKQRFSGVSFWRGAVPGARFALFCSLLGTLLLELAEHRKGAFLGRLGIRHRRQFGPRRSWVWIERERQLLEERRRQIELVSVQKLGFLLIVRRQLD